MTKHKGYRRGTRHKFARSYRQKGPEKLSTYLKHYRMGDIVDIKANGSIHKGLPHQGYHGRTGVVFNVTPRAVGVIVNKKVRHRIMQKRIHVRVEHINPSKSRDEHLQRVAQNDALKRAGKKTEQPLKRMPAMPEKAHFVTPGGQGVTTITPERYVLVM